jgi:hypothetical protein
MPNSPRKSGPALSVFFFDAANFPHDYKKNTERRKANDDVYSA